jgi:hypothetical protein
MTESKHDNKHNLRDVRHWLRTAHLLEYVSCGVYRSEVTHCECCAVDIARGEACYYWRAFESGLEYRLCGYCDVQAKIMVLDFGRKLKSAIYDPDGDSPYRLFDRIELHTPACQCVQCVAKDRRIVHDGES